MTPDYRSRFPQQIYDQKIRSKTIFKAISSNFITDIPFSKSSHSRIHEWCLEIIQITPQETCRLSGVINSSTTTTESCRRIFFGQKMSCRHLPFPSIKRTPRSTKISVGFVGQRFENCQVFIDLIKQRKGRRKDLSEK